MSKRHRSLRKRGLLPGARVCVIASSRYLGQGQRTRELRLGDGLLIAVVDGHGVVLWQRKPFEEVPTLEGHIPMTGDHGYVRLAVREPGWPLETLTFA